MLRGFVEVETSSYLELPTNINKNIPQFLDVQRPNIIRESGLRNLKLFSL